ncbi:UNVERIFIED_CONTAM: hypothetical protein Slati_3766000, partial [Sesamum latifolium]
MSDEQFIYCRLLNKRMSTNCLISVVYGDCDPTRRRQLWGDLQSLSKNIIEVPWCVLGDFNAIIDASESCGRSSDSNCYGGLQGVHFECRVGQWPQTSYLCALPRTSDHSPVILMGSERRPTRGMFRFDNFLAGQLSFIGTVRGVWLHHIHGTRMYGMVCKLKALKGPFRALRKAKGDLSDNVRLAKEYLEKAQGLLDRAKQMIYQITSSDGAILTEPNQVAAEFLSFFQSLLGGVRQRRTLNLEFLLPHLKHTLTEEEANAMITPVTQAEIRAAFFDIAEDSAPGPDGFSSGFSKAAWPEIGDDVSVAVSEFFESGKLLKQLNARLLVMISKKVLHTLIDYSQTAFVSGRSIADNVLLAQELLVGYNQARLPQRCTIKVDIQKAYDSVNWDFILESLRILKFPFRFISWVEQCITTVTFSISLNGSLQGFFPGSIGIRQGDPMSPYLFVIVPSVQCAIQTTLLEFAEMSGLRVNPGRAQLLKSVLSSLHMYWATVFLLPKSIIKVIEGKMRAFLWKGSSGSGYAKVSWVQVCKPKEEGGLGIRSVLHMNQALMLKHVWRILQQDPRSLWVAWVVRHKLRYQSIWATTPASASWCWKKIIKISSLLKEGLEYRVVLHHGQWSWPAESHFDIQEIVADLPSIGPQQSDIIRWKSGTFNTAAVLSLLQPASPHVLWHHLLGGKFKIPRHDFILWLAVLERLSTMDRLWASQSGADVYFAGCGWQRDIIWASRRWRGKHWLNAASRALLASLVYYVWRERNNRRLQSQRHQQRWWLLELWRRLDVGLLVPI